jgi:putative ABC transport system permease protein
MIRRNWELVRLALGSLRRTPLRITLTAVGVAIASGALLSMVGFALGVQARVEEPFQKMELVNRIDVTVKRPSTTGKEAEHQEGLAESSPATLDDAAVGRLAALSGVVQAYPELRLDRVRLETEGHTHVAPAIGLPREADTLRFVNDALVAGRFFARDGRAEVILGSKVVPSLGFARPEDAIGTPLTLHVEGLVPAVDKSFHLKERQLEIIVAGVWNPPGGGHGFTPNGIVLPLDLIKELPGIQSPSMFERLFQSQPRLDSRYERVVVRVQRPTDLFVVEKQIQDMGFQTQTLLGQLKEMRTAFLIMDLVLTAVGGVALVVSGLGIINTLLMSVLERQKEIGTYKALGASDGDVRLLFLAEAALVGLLGGLGGLALGRVVSWAMEVIVNAIGHSRGVEEDIVAFAFPLYLLGGVMLFALAVSLVSGVYPASRAARVDPIRALRAE